MDPPLSTSGADAEGLTAAEGTANSASGGDAGKVASAKEAHKPQEKKAKPVKKIKPCPFSSAAQRGSSPSPPLSPAGSPPSPLPVGATSSFSWDSLMKKPTFQAAPVECFKHVPLNQSWRNVCAGLKVEVAHRGVGRGAPTTYWVATLLQVHGYRGLFRPEGLGSNSSQDRWLEICSPEVKPVGWCAARGLPLTPPPAAGPAADWQKRLIGVLTGARTLPPAFYRKVMASLSRGSQLTAGQTVEVVDKTCISQVRAARITRQIGRRLHVHYLDAPDDDGGFWCHENSPLVHPVGWAHAVGHRIQAPPRYLHRCETRQFLAKDATEDCLPAPTPVTHEGFKVGMKLEALDPLNLSSIGVATVRQILGNHFIMVRLETSPDSDWFCYHAASPYIFPAGFCRTVGIPLTPPHGQAEGEPFSWEDYLRVEGAAAAPANLFHRPPLSHGFQPGHRLEAVDLMDPQLVCVATVGAVVGRLLRIHFDGWEEQFDQWADAESPDLFPVGWCKLVGYPLEPPRPPERPAPKKAAKRRSTGRRGRPRLRVVPGGGSRPQRAAAKRATAGLTEELAESESAGERGVEAESELESMTGDGESVAESCQSADGARRVSPPPTPESDGGALPSPAPAREPRRKTTPDSTPVPASKPAPEPSSEPAKEPQTSPQSNTQPMEVCEQETPDTAGGPATGETRSETPEVPADPNETSEVPMET